MISSLIFIFLLILENLILPALIGPGAFSIVPLFLISMMIYAPNLKLKFFQIILLAFVSEIVSGVTLGSFIIPLAIALLVYIWLNRFLNISSGLQENNSIIGLLMSATVIASIFYLYSLMFILAQSSFSIAETLNESRLMFASSVLSVIGWSAALTVISKYVLKTK